MTVSRARTGRGASGALACLALVRSLAAQGPTGLVTGSVADSSGVPIVGAEVSALGSTLRTRADERGEFRLPGVPAGDAALEARRLGFRPETLHVTVGAAVVTARFALRLMPTLLETVAVRGRERSSGRLAGFYERIATHTQGYFLTRDDIDRGNPRQLTDVLRRAPGVEIVRGGRVRLRGRNCAPLVWIDGVAMPAGETDVNSFAPSSLEGIELYMSASGAPARYQGTGDESRCGTVLLWSRGVDTDLRRAPLESNAERLEALRASGEVFVAGEVEPEATPLDSERLAVAYPPDLWSSGVGGVVVAQFVVDSAGRVEPHTFDVVSSPHPLLSRAVYDAVGGAAFAPAQRGGRPVRELVRMRFRFTPARGH